METRVNVADDRVTIDALECRDSDVVRFFGDAPVSARPDVACRALSVGIAGLRAMGVASHVEVVEREFLKLTQRFDATLASTQRELAERVISTFDPDQAQSVSARLATTVVGAHDAAGAVVAQARADLERLIVDSFNPDLATSCVYRIGKLVSDTRDQLDQAFDPRHEGSHLSTLMGLVESYFGDGGSLADLVAAQVAPAKAELLQALQGVRELVVGQAMASEERRRSPASGLDFEDEVEVVLCRLAAAYGDSVERVGALAGDTGRSKRGDFVVQLGSGPRFVIEAKKRSTAIPLRGDRGLLALLDSSMVNRASTFAIAVAQDCDAFAKEVGSFNDYDGNKLLCRLGQDGELLEAAYRWARATLIVAGAQFGGVDVDIVTSGIDEARRALREIGRVEGKAKAIAQGADEIQGMVSTQVRRLNSALDLSITGLEYPAQRVAS